MNRIIRLDRRHLEQAATIDNESAHQNSSKNVTKQEMRKQVRIRYEKGHEIFFGYREGKELVGYVTLKPFFPGYKHCELYWLAVKKKAQGRGIGTRLMEFIEKYAKEKGFRKICLYTGENMKRTRRFYEKRGYKRINKFPEYYGYPTGTTTAVLYAKTLEGNEK